jgi:hypothetical protein
LLVLNLKFLYYNEPGYTGIMAIPTSAGKAARFEI